MIPSTQTEEQRFLIRREGWVQPLLFLVGLVRDSNSYVTIERDRVRVRFGWFFNQTFALNDIDGVEPMRWPWYYGLGWRTNFTGLVGVVASTNGVVVLRFRQPQRVGGIVLFLKLGCNRLAASLREPDEFIEALQRRLTE